MKRSIVSLKVIGCALLATLWGSTAHAQVFVGSSGTLSASATFTPLPGNLLQVTLTNTSGTDVNDPANVLTAVFFNVAGNPLLSRDSAVLGAGSTVVYDPDGQPVGGVVGGEWAYQNSLNQYSANSGISSTGLGIFAPTSIFPGPDLSPPVEPNGINYGILPAGWSATGDNGGLTGSGGLIVNSVVFTLDNYTGQAITSVTFQYGTALTETHFGGGPPPPGGGQTGVPDGGSTVALLGLALGAIGLIRRRLA